MTTLVLFQPTPAGPFTFQATLDQVVYNCTVRWNVMGRWYLTITDQASNPIVTEPLIGSPDDYDINLVWSYFLTSVMVFRFSTQTFEIT